MALRVIHIWEAAAQAAPHDYAIARRLLDRSTLPSLLSVGRRCGARSTRQGYGLNQRCAVQMAVLFYTTRFDPQEQCSSGLIRCSSQVRAQKGEGKRNARASKKGCKLGQNK